MRFTVAVHTILAHSVLAKVLPNPLPSPTGTGFSVDLVKRFIPDDIHDHEKRAGGLQTSVGVTNLSIWQQKWTIDVGVGGQTLPTVFDTGSQDIWFESNMEPASMTQSGVPKYTPTASTNSIPGSTWAAHFGNPSPVAQGVAYYETIVIGAATVTSQVVGAATSISSKTTDRKAGILGLSPCRTQSNYNTTHPPPSVMGNLISQLNVTQFALDLRYDSGSRLDFGFIDPSRYQGSITWANRNTYYNNWYIVLDNVFYVNNTRQLGNMSNNNLTHMDSGTPGMNFPDTIVRSYYNSLPAFSLVGSSYYFDCGLVKNGTLPSFSVSVSGNVFTVPGVWMWASQSGSTCYGSLQSSGNSESILGDMFLRTVFAVFDTKGAGQVGLASKSLPARALPS